MILRSIVGPAALVMLAGCQATHRPSPSPELASLATSIAAPSAVTPTEASVAPTMALDIHRPVTPVAASTSLDIGDFAVTGYEPTEPPQSGGSSAETKDHFGPEKGVWQVTLAGNGSSDQNFEAGGFQVGAAASYFLLDWLNVGLRQDLGFSNSGGPTPSTSWNGGTRGFVQGNLQLGHFVPFIGVNFGGVYGGRGVADSLAAGIEGGLKWYVKHDAFVLLGIDYQWFFNSIDSFGNTFDSGRFVYGVGFGLDF